ncbi:MAG: CDP-diacylglycerol--glycerol-3-phosphate 3-phosphatidyltransferase [Clostridiales bacterium]|nr:CDP-diacylglycerol--glycerol-3-phosphate 3-phosphatidyltransferase [Clostridiales bacterium]
MNLPNKLTILRVLMIPLFCVFLAFSPDSDLWRWISLAVFALACLTDWADGKIARQNNLVTNFGKFMDPIADKLLVMSAFVMLCSQGRMEAWAVIVIMAREFIVSGFRLVAAEGGVVIAASTIAKFKTVSQMLAVMLTIVFVPGPLAIVAKLVLYVAVVLTALSGIDYVWKNRQFLKG